MENFDTIALKENVFGRKNAIIKYRSLYIKMSNIRYSFTIYKLPQRNPFIKKYIFHVSQYLYTNFFLIEYFTRLAYLKTI